MVSNNDREQKRTYLWQSGRHLSSRSSYSIGSLPSFQWQGQHGWQGRTGEGCQMK